MSFLKKMINSYKISIASFFLLILFIVIYSIWLGSPIDLLQSGLQSIIFYIVPFILVGTGFLEYIRNIKEEPNKIERKKIAYNTVKGDYNSLLKDLGDDLYQFLAKEIYSSSEEEFKNNTFLQILEIKLEEIKNEINIYFKDNFYEINPVHYFPDLNKEFTLVSEEIDIELFMDKIKHDDREKITNFLNKYSSILPEDLKDKLYDLESLIDTTPIFTHFQSLGIKDVHTKVDTDYERMKNDYEKILDKVIELIRYFEEYEKLSDEDRVVYKVKDNY